MPKKLELTRRRLIGGLGTIGLASAGAGLGTSAYLNDTEEFENNMLTAGTLDLAVDYVVHENQGTAGDYTINSFTGEVNGSADDDAVTIDGNTISQNLDDVKPGDWGYSRFCFTIDDNPAYLWACGELTSTSESTGDNEDYTEPEPEDNNGEGELEENIEVEMMYCDLDDDGNLLDTGGTIYSGTLNDLLDQLHGGIPLDGDHGDIPLDGSTGDASTTPGNQTPFEGTGGDAEDNPCVCIEWKVPTTVGNEIQGDSLTFDLQFNAEQSRHNDGTHNPCLEGETGEGWAKERRDFSPSVNARGRFGDNNAGTADPRELDIRDSSDAVEANGGYEWTDGGTESFEVSYDSGTVTLDVGGDTISTSAVGPSDDDVAITVGASGGDVDVENVQVNGQSPNGADSVSASGDTQHLFIAGGGLADGDSITGDVTFSWSGTPSEEGLKFRVDA